MDFSSQLDDPLEQWVYRLLLTGVMAITFSIALGQTFFIVSFLLFLVVFFRGRVNVQVPIIIVPTILFGAVAVISAYFGAGETIAEDGSRSSIGIIPTKELLWFLVMLVSATVITSTDRLRNLMRVFALGCGVLSLDIVIGNPIRAWFLYKNAGVGSHNPDGVPEFYQSLLHQGSMTDGQFLMIGLVVTFGLFLLGRLEKQHSIGWLLLYALELAAFIINFKRGSWICAVIIMGLFLIIKTNWRYVLALVVVVMGVCMVPYVNERLSTLTTEISNPEKGGRMYMWKTLYPTLVQKYPNGVGYGNLTPEIMEAAGPKVEPNRNHMHSNFLTIRAETGAIGAWVYVAMMLWGVTQATLLFVRARHQSYAREICTLLLLLTLCGLIANGLIEYNFGDSELLLIYGVIFGVVGSRIPLRDSGGESRPTKFNLG